MTLTTGTVTNLAAAEGSATAQVVGQGTANLTIAPELCEYLAPLQREIEQPTSPSQKATNIMARLRVLAAENADVFVNLFAALLKQL